MKPYYEEAGITIYHGDCRDIVQYLSAYTVISDPPYGMSYKPTRGSDGSKKWGDRTVAGDDEDFDPRWLLDGIRFPRVVLWGANHYSELLPSSPGWIIWDKTPRGRKEGFIAADVEMAWTNCLTRPLKFSMQWGGEQRGGEGFFHPTQKPVALMDWVIRTCAEGIILDPYMGAGPVLVAAKNLDRKAIGIELEERYCEIAANRLRQSVLNFEVPA